MSVRVYGDLLVKYILSISKAGQIEVRRKASHFLCVCELHTIGLCLLSWVLSLEAFFGSQSAEE